MTELFPRVVRSATGRDKIRRLKKGCGVKSAPPCIPCIFGQVLGAARQVTEDEWLHRKVLEEVMASLPGTDWTRSPAELLGDALALARKTLRSQDAFRERRREALRTMKEIAKVVRAEVEASKDPIATAAVAAAAANVVDALALGPVNVASAFAERRARGFAAGNPDDLKAALDHSKNVLFVLDNAGEAAIDLVLVEQIVKGGAAVTIAARRPGLFHDATIEDAVEAGFEGTVIDTGQDGLLGSAPVLCGPEFRAAFDAADLIVAKGSAAYETLTGERKETVFLIHAKCEPVARALGVAVFDLALLKT